MGLADPMMHAEHRGAAQLWAVSEKHGEQDGGTVNSHGHVRLHLCSASSPSTGLKVSRDTLS